MQSNVSRVTRPVYDAIKNNEKYEREKSKNRKRLNERMKSERCPSLAAALRA